MLADESVDEPSPADLAARLQAAKDGQEVAPGRSVGLPRQELAENDPIPVKEPSGEGFEARNHYPAPGDVGTLITVAGAAILASSDSPDAARQLVAFLLGEEAQRYFTDETFEYPLIAGMEANADLPSIADLEPVALDLSRLEDLRGTLALLRATGVLP